MIRRGLVIAVVLALSMAWSSAWAATACDMAAKYRGNSKFWNTLCAYEMLWGD